MKAIPTALFLALSPPVTAGEGLYDAADPDLPAWLRSHNYLAAPPSAAEASPITLENTGSAPLRCEITLAHWYVIHPEPLPSGGRLNLPLRFEPQSGTVSWLNDAGAEMALEGLSCGAELPGARLDFRKLARAAQGAGGLTLRCDPAAGCAPAPEG